MQFTYNCQFKSIHSSTDKQLFKTWSSGRSVALNDVQIDVHHDQKSTQESQRSQAAEQLSTAGAALCQYPQTVSVFSSSQSSTWCVPSK